MIKIFSKIAIIFSLGSNLFLLKAHATEKRKAIAAFSPAGKIWYHEGGDSLPKSLIFHRDGVLELTGHYTELSPGKWKYDAAKKELLVTLPKIRHNDALFFKDQAGKRADKYKVYPKKFNSEKNEIIFEFPKRILFLDYVYSEKEEFIKSGHKDDQFE
jgi:hypothetical protein